MPANPISATLTQTDRDTVMDAVATIKAKLYLSGLSRLAQLTYLSVSGTQIADLSILNGLTQLTHLFLFGTQITDLSGLSRLTQLTHLYLPGTQVTDVSCLEHLHDLKIFRF